MKHELKTWPQFFPALLNGTKNFEIRKNDRDFKVGDELILQEFIPCEICKGTGIYRHDGENYKCDHANGLGKFTGRWIAKFVSFITDWKQQDGTVVMGLSSIPIDVEKPEILYFGCDRVSGHYLHSRRVRVSYHETPWGNKLDGGIKAHYAPLAIAYEKRGGWSAISFDDRSVDSRPGSHSTFLTRIELTPEEILKFAREQWPDIFDRPKFPQIRRVVEPQ